MGASGGGEFESWLGGVVGKRGDAWTGVEGRESSEQVERRGEA